MEELHAAEAHLNQMDQEEKTQLESGAPQIAKITEEAKAKAEDTEITQPIGFCEAAEEPVSKQELIKEAESPDSLIAAPAAAKETSEIVAAQTTEQLEEEPINQSNVTSALETVTGVASASPNPEEEAKETTEQVGEADKDVILVKEETKEARLPDATPVAVSDANPAMETSEETTDAEPNHEEEKVAVEFSHATPPTETENVLAYVKQDTELAQVEAEGPEFQDTADAATGAVQDKEIELAKEEIKEFEFPDASPAATPAVEAELTPEFKEPSDSEAAAVTEVHTEKEETPDERADAAYPVIAETEVTEILPEKKKKRALGDHLAEEKANDSVKGVKKQAPDEKVELMTNAVAPTGSTEISSRDVNTVTTDDTKTEADEADEKKEENEKVVENGTPTATGETTAECTEVAQQQEGDKVAKKEPIAAGEAGKEEVASKSTSRGSNNILSKVKHQIVKVKKAIGRKSPSSKNMKVDNKDEIKAN